MAEMLANPSWVPSHALMLVGFVSFFFGLASYYRSAAPGSSARLRRWLLLAMCGTALQVVEMALHTAAYVDAANLVAGRSTPVLTTHLVMTPLFYPIFGVTVAGFVIVASGDRAIGSPWIGWLGVLGVLAHGAAGVLVPVFNVEWARVLFPMIVAFAVWAVIAGLWPSRAHTSSTVQPVLN